jgi:ATP:cob(I)alamin adenosyltransferase
MDRLRPPGTKRLPSARTACHELEIQPSVGARLRAICRRAERRATELASEEDTVNETAVVYLNRLSDVLFTLARVVNDREGVREENPTY